jgi:hypothetical protein
MAASRCWQSASPTVKRWRLNILSSSRSWATSPNQTHGQKFERDRLAFKFFERTFLKIEDDKSLIVPDRWIQMFVPIRTLDPFPKAEARAVVVKAVQSVDKGDAISDSRW